jgi:hypothetical protein
MESAPFPRLTALRLAGTLSLCAELCIVSLHIAKGFDAALRIVINSEAANLFGQLRIIVESLTFPTFPK